MNTFGLEYGVVMEAPGNNKDCSQVKFRVAVSS